MCRESIENNGNWFVASIVMSEIDVHNSSLTSENTWENTYLVKSENISSAYDKATSIGKSECRTYNSDKDVRGTQWVFLGVSELVPVFEDIEDGAEILWTDHSSMHIDEARSLTRPQEFWIDRDSPGSKGH